MKLIILAVAVTLACSNLAQSETRKICSQDASFELVPLSAEITADQKKWQGIWVGTLETGACVGLVVENIKSDGTASAKLIVGKSMVGQTVYPAAMSDNVGKIENGTLTVHTKSNATATYKFSSDKTLDYIFAPASGSFKGQLSKQ